MKAIYQNENSSEKSIIRELMAVQMQTYLTTFDCNIWSKINQNTIQKIIDKMKYIETDILLSEINKLLQELKEISIEKQEIESKLLLCETQRMNNKFWQLVESKSDDMGS